jgi:hypothetical protein
MRPDPLEELAKMLQATREPLDDTCRESFGGVDPITQATLLMEMLLRLQCRAGHLNDFRLLPFPLDVWVER